MNHIFQPRGFFTVPDGTDVSPFLNATDSNQTDVPWDALGEMSIAAGRIRAGGHSAVHMHPVITQVTYVVAGTLTIRMQDADATRFYDLLPRSGEAVLTRPGTLFQLRNDSAAVAEVLYITSPSYVFEMTNKGVIYDDAVLIAKSWEELEDGRCDDIRIANSDAFARREAAQRRLAVIKRGH